MLVYALALLAIGSPAAADSALALGAPALAAHDRADPVEKLVAWVERYGRTRRGIDAEAEDDLHELLRDVRGFSYSSDGARHRTAIALTDMLTAGLRDALERDAEVSATGEKVRALARKELEWLLDEPLVTWLVSDVLSLRGEQPTERRVTIMSLLRDWRLPEVRSALSICAREPEPAVQEAACEALVGWDEESVHALFLSRLASGNAPISVLGSAESHFRGLKLAANSRSAAGLAAYVRERLTDESWRTASRAIALSHSLDDRVTVPPLIEALSLWNARVAAGRPVRRIQQDIVRELRRRSGRSIGARPESWRTWWNAVLAGNAVSRASDDDGGDAQVTEAAFFGLRPMTDRVVFVLDRSGSMGWDMRGYVREPAPATTRLRRSIDELLSLLEGLGESTWFNVVLFNDGTDAWRSELSRASPANLRSVRSWLLRRQPAGGTRLRGGIERAMRLGSDGEVDLEQLAADTLIVLCDGFQTGGSAWIVPLLRRQNAAARLVVHCVQIGREGDGSLELLSEETGGDFVALDG